MDVLTKNDLISVFS